MANRIMTIELLDRFAQYLREEERSDATLEKYLREVRQFFLWLSGAQVSKPLYHSGRNTCFPTSTIPPPSTAN